MIRNQLKKLFHRDTLLKPYREALFRRLVKVRDTEMRLTEGKTSLSDFASGHEYFGLHYRNNRWVFREWAPNATAVYLVGNMTDWREKKAFALKRLNREGVWEITLSPDAMQHGDLYRLKIHWPGGRGDRIPAWARRVVQDPETLIFNAQVWMPPSAFRWQYPDFTCPASPRFVYEAHIGMAQDEAKVGTYKEFTDKILPRIVRSGYNTLQLMAVQEHPYYGSFGYQVSSFFAASSRFGVPEDLKELVDAAHASGISVIMDIIHSHAAANEVEGLSRFDGTPYQYFHEGQRGYHRVWDSRCFNYGKPEVLHFLLSNCRFWLDEYRFDGFRFDGVTSMLYLDHGLHRVFTSYTDYFDSDVDEDALVYLTLANKVVHEVRPDAITIAEDVSGMPGLALPIRDGGNGFDYRFAMGVPDYWIKLLKEIPDEEWPLGHLWFELNNRRSNEKTISYAESHDQALVGDKTIIFRLMDADMYHHMMIGDENLNVDRGVALHKMIRLVTMATAADGYLNFMGNEFGHPEWIDFPREGNNWSYEYARRQWYLVDDPGLKYRFLGLFDRDMIAMANQIHLLESPAPRLILTHSSDRVLAFTRSDLLFVFNFHPTCSFSDYRMEVPPGKYMAVLNSDDPKYGGHGRINPEQEYFTIPEKMSGYFRHSISLYLPTRTALVLRAS
ncbi:MAG: 1,4-alpha-glucan-branching enzyme [Deltaproteobacteria bacterium]|nr:1,4-alpha-glucan-branching enzyme [Deltaproteobacteria bacterium]